MLADLCINTCKTIEADGSLHASNSGRGFLNGAGCSTLEILGPSDGTFIATDGSNEAVAVRVVVVVAISNGNKVVDKRHGLF